MQVYASALPVSYEATLRAGVQNGKQAGNKALYLTLLGDGAPQDRPKWIISAIRRALDICRDWPTDVAIVSYERPDPDVSQLVFDWK